MKARKVRMLKYIIAFLFPMQYTLAQEIKYELEFVPSTEIGQVAYKDICVQDKEGGYHAINKTQCKVSLSVDDYDAIECVVEFNKPTGTFESLEWPKESTKLFSIKDNGEYFLSLRDIRLFNDEDTIEIEEKRFPRFRITLHEVPAVENNLKGRADEVIWNNTVRSFTIERTGGFDDGWQYEWIYGDSSIGNGEQYNGCLSEAKEGKKLSIKAKNIAPDGKTVWFEQIDTCKLYVYTYPTTGLRYLKKSCPSEMDWYCADSSGEKIEISTSYGDDNGWYYEWTDNGETVCIDKDFRPSMNGMDVDSYDEGTKRTYSVKMQNLPKGMADSLKYVDTINVVINFWKTPSVKIGYDDYKNVFEKNDVYFHVDFEGGIPEGSTEITLPDGKSVKVERQDTLCFKSTEVDDATKEEKYSLKATFGNGYSHVTVDAAINVMVWNTPRVMPYYLSNNPELKKKNVVDTENDTIYFCERFGEYILIGADTEFGDDNAWERTWKCLTDGSVYFGEDKSVDESSIYKLTISNTPEGVKQGWEKEFFYTVVKCPKPEISLSSIAAVYAGFVGDSLSLRIGSATGIGGEWRYAWKKQDESAMLTSSTLPLVLDGDTKETQIWNATPNYYGPEGDIWSDESDMSKTISVHVYPRPTLSDKNFVGCESTRIDAYYEGERNYTVGFNGEYPYATEWSLQVMDADETVEKGNGTSFKYVHKVKPLEPKKDEGKSHTQVRLTANCLVHNIEADTLLVAYIGEKDLDYYAWRKGSVEKDESQSYVYHGDRVYLSAETKYGYDGGWTYQWMREDNVIDNANGLVYSYSCTNETNSTAKTVYQLLCRNELNGEVGTEDTLRFEIDEYAEAKAAEPITKGGKVRQGDSGKLEIKSPRNGNPDGWQYQWVGPDEKLSDENWKPKGNGEEIPSFPIDKYEMSNERKEYGTEDRIYTLHYRNVDPDEKEHEKGKVDFTITICRKPQTPTLQKKGDGTSQIYIASSESDRVEYEFGLDATLPDGNEEVEGSVITNKNYYRYKFLPQNPWLRVRWDYDGFKCYSDVAIPSSPSNASRSLTIEEGYFYVSLDEETAATVLLLSLDGKLVKESHYTPRLDYCEKLDYNGIAPGMYLVKCMVGMQQVVRKVMIR